MNILCITHADFETPGVIETWAHQKGYDFTISRPYKGERLFQTTIFNNSAIFSNIYCSSSKFISSMSSLNSFRRSLVSRVFQLSALMAGHLR